MADPAGRRFIKDFFTLAPPPRPDGEPRPAYAPASPRIQSRRSVSAADFPAYWAAYWKAQGHEAAPADDGEETRRAKMAELDRALFGAPRINVIASAPPPDSIPGSLAAARARMGALTGDRA